MEGHYCEKCRKFVLVVPGEFFHPHGKWQSCLICARCGGMVYFKEQNDHL